MSQAEQTEVQETESAPVARILVVDDNPTNVDLLSRRLIRKGFDVDTALDGQSALDLIAQNDFALILLDIMMPGMDGYEVLERIRSEKGSHELPVIMATARKETEDIVKALKLGANDYVTKPIDFPVVLARVETHIKVKQSVDQIKDLEESVKRKNEYMRDSLESAARFQKSLLPKKSPENSKVDFAWIYEPCDELAGDTFDVFEFDDNCIGFYQLDVTGHGVKAALLAVTLNRLLTPNSGQASLVLSTDESGAQTTTDPVNVVEELNQEFQINEESNQFFTMVYGILDLETLTVSYVNAAHSYPILSGSEGVRELDSESGFPIGVAPEVMCSPEAVQLQSGDRFFVYSDGIIEAMNPDGDLFGEERLMEIISSMADKSLNQTINAVRDEVVLWTQSTMHQDDVSILGLAVR